VFFALILLHVAAALFHALVRRDGVFETMVPVSAHAVSTHDGVAAARSPR
jgi:cytochrome b561